MAYFCPGCRAVEAARSQLRELADVEQNLRLAQPQLAVPPRPAYTVFATEIHRCAVRPEPKTLDWPQPDWDQRLWRRLYLRQTYLKY